VIARQPIGHQVIATSPNGYVYRPVYADDATAASIQLPDPQESISGPPVGMSRPSAVASPEALREAALVLFKAAKYEAAIDRLNRLIDLKPDDGDAWLLLVQCQFGLANYEAVADALANALATSPELDWGKYVANYQRYFASSLRFAMHLRTLERFVELHPDRFEGHLMIGYQYGSLGETDRAIAELALAKPNVEADKLTRHFAAAQVAPAPAPDDELNGPALPNRAANPAPPKRRGREF
jgi:tetratricopeptide (TPR) repeat protein